MFTKKSNGLTITVGEEDLVFSSPKEFEFALLGRTGLPASNFARLSESTETALLKEIDGIRQTEQRFVDVLSQSMEDPAVISRFMKNLDISSVSQDYEWRTVFGAVNALDDNHLQYKKAAHIKYMQYLTNRQEVIKRIYTSRVQARGGLMEKSADNKRPEDEFKETAIFDLTTLAGTDKKDAEFSRLPKGETIEITLEPNEPVEVMLAKHRFSLIADGEIQFIRKAGDRCRLHPGKNIVGRDSSNDVIIDENLRDVSRKHLIIETEGNNLIRLTDISSMGTFVPPEYLDITGI
ncbi:MAG: hypothetical protein DRQ37_00245 [Gammaproteobacteria bacterium]|nr:MAG: hypothetical protein DRQ37_00245 [Gammaproteobacteria bacterium]